MVLDSETGPVKVTVAYIAVAGGSLTEDYCTRFVSTYHEYPPGAEHDLLVLCNGGPLKTSCTVLFSGMNARMFPRENDPGWDISAYIHAANGPCADSDIILCLGESNYFHRAGWLKRIVEAWEKHGPGMYGPYATNVIRSHLQTTAFACSPIMLRQYPKKVATGGDRYEFEHGERAMWRLLAARGYPVRLVTWDGEWIPRAFRVPNGIIWRGNQENCLMWCNHTDHFRDADTRLRTNWARSADRPFK